MILVFCLSKAFSQVGPPDLRCLQVAINGDVTLTWLSPPDPSNTFYGYAVYSSFLSAGPFSLVAVIPGSVFTTTYTHAGAGANGQSRYYFMKSLSGAAGVDTSAASVTLRSIHLYSSYVLDALQLKYNDLHQPKLATSTGTFNILKDYPIGNWNYFGSTANLTYDDTLSAVCNFSIGYQVTQQDVSGCTSTSDVYSDLFKDYKAPGTPGIIHLTILDSISVLPNGDVILAWTIPRDLDITKYSIVTLVNDSVIDYVVGRNHSSYTTTSTATSGTVNLSVFATDSCGNPGNFQDTVSSTIFLKAKYNQCAYQTNLSWNPYDIIPNGLKEYRIYCAVDTGPFDLVGVTTQVVFTHSNVPPGKNLCYYVRVFNNGLTISSSSNRTCFFSSQVAAPSFVYMRAATVTDKNLPQLRLYLDTLASSAGIDIYRSDDGITFKDVGFVVTGHTPDYVFTDNTGDASNASYYYKAIVKDSCGNSRAFSNVSKTILLKAEDDKQLLFTKHLNWNQYQGFSGGVSGYNVYRIVNGVPTSDPVGSTDMFTTLYTDELEDEAPEGSKIDYVVVAVEGIGNTYGFMESALSNVRPVYMEDKLFIPSAFAPNGLNKVWLPITHFVDKSEYNLMIFNRWGDKVFQTSDDTEGWGGNGAPSGVYAYSISYKNSRGEYQQLNGTLFLYE